MQRDGAAFLYEKKKKRACLFQTGHLLDGLHGKGQGAAHGNTGHQAGIVVGEEAAGHITSDVEACHGLVVGVQGLALFVDGNALLGGQQRGTQPAAIEGSGADGCLLYTSWCMVVVSSCREMLG